MTQQKKKLGKILDTYLPVRSKNVFTFTGHQEITN